MGLGQRLQSGNRESGEPQIRRGAREQPAREDATRAQEERGAGEPRGPAAGASASRRRPGHARRFQRSEGRAAGPEGAEVHHPRVLERKARHIQALPVKSRRCMKTQFNVMSVQGRFWLPVSLLLLSLLASVAAERPVRIALMSDLHVSRGTNETQPFHRGRLDRAIAAVNAANVDLVLLAGDLTENGTRREFSDLRKALSSLKAPVWFVPGNHDLGGKLMPGKTNKNEVSRQRVRNFERALGPTWFVREHAGVRVVGVNGSILGSGFPEEGAMWAGLSNALSAAASTPTLMLIHYPPFTEKPDEPGGVYWNVEPGPRKRLLGLVQTGKVGAVLSGHLHREILRREDGRLYVTTPPVAFGLPSDRQYRGWTLLTVPAEGDLQAEFRYLMN